MEQEDPSSYESPRPDQLPDAQTSTHHALPSQPEFVGLLEESQQTNHDDVGEYSAPEQYPQSQSPIQQPSGPHFSRPTIETTEEIAAGFQFQIFTPARSVQPSPNGPQSKPSLQRVPNPQRIYPSYGNFETRQPAEPSIRQEVVQLATSKDDVGGSGIEPGWNDTPVAAAEPRGTQKEVVHDNRLPRHVDKRSVISDPKTPDFPFPDETESPCSKKRKNRHLNSSPFANDPLPKSYAQIRHRALAEQSPRSRAPITRSLASAAKIERLASQATRRNGSIERTQPSGDSQSSKRVHEAPGQLHTDVDLIAKKHQAKQHKNKSLTRPIPAQCLADEAATTTRPNSRASNISKHRVQPSHRRRGETPTREQQTAHLKKFADSWNTNFLYNQQLLDRWEQKITMLEKHIENQDSTIEQCYRDIEVRDETINTLSKEIEEQHTQAQTVQDEIATASAARKKLEDKLRLCRSRLNDAIKEQQQLFLKCRERFQETTECIREESRVHQDSLEKATANMEVVRGNIKQEVAAVINDITSQINELNKTIKSLEVQLDRSEQDLARQRDDAASLREQLADSQKLNDQSLQLIAAQNRELLEKLSQDRQTADERDGRIEEQGQKIDTILTALEGVKSMTVDQVALTEDIRRAHDDTVNTIVAELQSSVQTVNSAVVHDQQALNDNLDQIHDLCNGISKEMNEVKSGVDWQTIAQEAQFITQDQQSQINGLRDELQQTRVLLDKKSEEQVGLQRQLDILQANSKKEEIAATKIKDLTTQVQQLRAGLTEKDAALAGSKKDLAALQNQLRTEAHKLRNLEEQIQSDRQAHAEAIEEGVRERDQAISDAVAQETKTINEKCQLEERQLREHMRKERAQLEQALVQSRLAAETENENRAVVDEEFHRIRGELAAASTSITKLTGNLEESEHKREALLESLEQWSRDRSVLGQMKERLDQLGKDQPDAIQMKRGLQELLELQRNLSSTVEYHQKQLDSAEAAAANFNPISNPQSGADHLALESQNLKRKVMVRSPVEDDNHASPVSIEEERRTRRHTTPSRSIMKLLTPTASGDSQVAGSGANVDSQMPIEPQPAPKRKVARRGSKSTLNTHSMYNRPVAGSVPEISQEQEDASQVGSQTHKSDATLERGTSGEEVSGGRFNSFSLLQDPEEPPIKRQRTSEVDQQPTQVSRTPMTKLIHSMAEYFTGSKPRGQETAPAPRTISSRGGPLERRQSGLITYGQSSLKRGRSSSQSSFGSSQAVTGSDGD